MPTNNTNLQDAKANKNDEFFTILNDVEEECEKHKEHFSGKTIFCNCNDSPDTSFAKYFSDNFNEIGLKKLICTTYKRYQNGCLDTFDGKEWKHLELKGTGSYSSEECLEVLKYADVVVTNPPFSKFRDFIRILFENNKKFLIIGNLNAVTYADIFPYVKNNKLWFGSTCFYGGSTYFYGNDLEFDKDKIFRKLYYYEKDDKFHWRVNGVRWFTNIDHKKRHKPLELTKTYSEGEYKKYDNYDAIEVSRVANIPKDYDGVMGVPISFIDKYCPEQFEIVGLMNGGRGDGLINGNDGRPKFYLNEKVLYARILIRRK